MFSTINKLFVYIKVSEYIILTLQAKSLNIIFLFVLKFENFQSTYKNNSYPHPYHRIPQPQTPQIKTTPPTHIHPKTISYYKTHNPQAIKIDPTRFAINQAISNAQIRLRYTADPKPPLHTYTRGVMTMTVTNRRARS